MEEGKITPTIKGTPQGGVISPLLANITLDHLDWFLDEHGLNFVRYADDFVILCKTETEAKKALELVQKFLNGMKLEDKSRENKDKPLLQKDLTF